MEVIAGALMAACALVRGIAETHRQTELAKRLAELEKERGRTIRLLIVTGALMTIAAGCFTVFAPRGRETISYMVGAVHFVVALGVLRAAAQSISRSQDITLELQNLSGSTTEPRYLPIGIEFNWWN